MPATQGVWGIDIGQSALKALRMETIDGVPTATAFDYIEHPKILSQPDADPDQLTREALEKFLSRNAIKGDLVAIGVPGQSGLARFVKLPPVEEKKIIDIVKFRRSTAALDEKDALVIRFGHELIGQKRLTSETFALALKMFGKEGVTDLAGLMAFYNFLYTVSNVTFDIQMPAGQEPLLPIP